MYHLYGMPKTRATRVLWALEELEVDYQYHLVNLVKGEGQAPEFLRLNPSGKVPVLVDGDLVLSESAAICTYLGDMYPESRLVPQPGTGERGLYEQWCHFVMAELEQPLWTIGKHKFALPEEKRVPAVVPVAGWEFQRAAAVLAKGLEGKNYLVDGRFTMVDILAAHTLVWARAFKIPHDIAALDEYQARICARDAFSRVRQKEASVQQE